MATIFLGTPGSSRVAEADAIEAFLRWQGYGVERQEKFGKPGLLEVSFSLAADRIFSSFTELVWWFDEQGLWRI